MAGIATMLRRMPPMAAMAILLLATLLTMETSSVVAQQNASKKVLRL